MSFLNKLGLLFLFCFIGLPISAQKKDKDWLLVDSVDYNTINPLDKELLDSLLPLYHQAKNDSTRLRILSDIIENCNDDGLWPHYNSYMLKLTEQGDGSRFYLLYQASALNNIGYLVDHKGNVLKAIEYYKQALELREKINDKKGIAESINNLGTLYSYQNDTKAALAYYQSAAKLYKEIGDMKGLAQIYNNLGISYNEFKDVKKSLIYNTEALKIQKEINDVSGMSNSYVNMGADYKDLGDTSKALEYYNLSLNLRKELGSKSDIATSLFSLGNYYYELGNLNKAQDLLHQSLQLAKEAGYPFEIQNTSRSLYLIYRKKHNDSKALEMLELYDKMTDSINDVEQVRIATSTKYQIEAQQQKAVNEKKMLIEEAEQRKQRLLTLFMIGVALAAAIAVLIIYKNLQRHKKAKRLIEKQKNIVEEKQKEILDSIRYAKRIQDAVLKEQEHVSAHLPGHFVIFKPKDIVSGDFYWSIEKNNHWYVAAADCTGHGVPGAFLTILGTSFLNEINATDALHKPSDILDKLRERMISELSGSSNNETKDGMDISLARLNLETKELMWAGANNPLWILTKDENQQAKILTIAAHKQPIGYFPTLTPYPNHIIQLKKGDVFYLFTDGLADQFGGKYEKKLKYKPIKELLLKSSNVSMTEQKQILLKYFEEWKGDFEQTDDICMIGITVY